MRKQNCLILFFVFFCGIYNANINAQEKVLEDNFKRLSFDIELNKTEYLPLEPIFVQIKVTNKTDESFALLTIPNFKRLSLEITHNGITETFGSPFVVGPGRSGLLLNLEKGQAIAETLVLESYLSKMFPKPGYYRVRFSLNNGRDEGLRQEISSDIKEITIKNPTEIDKKAVEFLQQNQGSSLFWWKDQKEGEDLLEIFVQKYSRSVFGEYAIYRLAIGFAGGQNFQRAKSEFEKISMSKNEYIADGARKYLAEIEAKIKSVAN